MHMSNNLSINTFNECIIVLIVSWVAGGGNVDMIYS